MRTEIRPQSEMHRVPVAGMTVYSISFYNHLMDARATILVVDDDKMIAGFLNDLLSEAGYNVRMVHNGQDALDRFDFARTG